MEKKKLSLEIQLRDKVKVELISQGLELIPLKDKRPVDRLKWKEYRGTIPDKSPFGIKLGGNSKIYVVDVDSPLLLQKFKHFFDRTYCVQSGNGGHIFVLAKNDLPKQNKNMINDKGQKIDIKTSGGYVVGETSQYYNKIDKNTYEKTDKHYTKISNSRKINHIPFSEIEVILRELGFIKDEPIKDYQKNWNIDDLLKGGFELGQRRRKENSLYVKLRFRGSSSIQAFERVQEVNRTCKPEPLNEYEINYNCKHAEEFYQQKKDEPRNIDKAESEDFVKKNSKDKGVIDIIAKNIQKKYNFVTLSDTNEILLYTGKIYSKAEAESQIKGETENRIIDCTTHDRNEVINKIKAQTYTNLKDFDVDTNLITLDNGVLNLVTLGLKDHDPSYQSRVLLPVEFHKPEFEIHDETIFDDIEKNLKDTLFWKFLKRSFTIKNIETKLVEFRKEDFETVLEIISCPIIKKHIDEKAFMFLGQGENGKSVCLDYIKSLIGSDNISRITLQQIADDKFMCANLSGKSANIFTDLEPGELKHAGKIKALTSGEGIEAQEKYMKPFTLDPFCKLMFSCNRFPKVYDQSHAFFRRWMIVKWERNFENDPERIEYLREKLNANQEEKNMVFSSLVYLARKLNRLGKFTHNKDSKTIQKEWNENADPIDWFDSNYIKDSDHNKSKRATYHFYKKVMLSKGEPVLGMGQFSKAFAEYHDELITKEGRTERVWLNITFDDVFLEQGDRT